MVVEDLIKAIKPDEEKRNKTYSAVVSKIDKEGVIWVYVNGSNKDTPTASTSSEVKAGDSVNVEWRNNKLYIVGNASNPSAGVIRVDAVEQSAQIANEAANSAVRDAGIARAAAEAVEGIAEEAKENAGIAKKSADTALFSLSQIEDVVGTLNWITEHGEYLPATEWSETATYYTRSGSGTEQDPYVYTIVAEPKQEELSSYYVLNVDESIENFINTHLSLTQYGLNLKTMQSDYYLHQGTVDGQHPMGVYILDGANQICNMISSDSSQVGRTDGAHITLTSVGGTPRLGLWENETNEVAFITNDEMQIKKTVVLESMKVGNWQWASIGDAEQGLDHLRLQWVYGGN